MTFRALFLALALALPGSADVRPRLIVLTDIGGDPDDEQSMVRLMVHSSEFDIEGLIASASGTPGELKANTTRPDLIRRIVEAYGQVQPNLRLHHHGFPTASDLLAAIRSGNDQRGMKAVGAGMDTEGSRHIVDVVDRRKSGPVHVAVWGGPTDLAQALWHVRSTRSPSELQKFVAKLRVFAIGHQDDTGPWIMREFLGLFYILASMDPADVLGHPYKGKDRRTSSYRGMYLGGDESLTSREWIETNVRNGHGPLGALYPNRTWTAPNPHSSLKEGDTPSWFYFLPNGVGDPGHPEWGSFGGRFRRVGGKHFNDAQDSVNGTTDARATVWRWRPAFQAEFAARMDWCVQSRDEANHLPVARLVGVPSKVNGGSTVRLDASGSKDPDKGQELSYKWWVYKGAGTFTGDLDITTDGPRLTFRAPHGKTPQTVHIMLEVSDNGTPALTSFRRAVIQIAPGR